MVDGIHPFGEEKPNGNKKKETNYRKEYIIPDTYYIYAHTTATRDLSPLFNVL